MSDCSEFLSCSGELQDPLFQVYSRMWRRRAPSSANRRFVTQSRVLLRRMPLVASCHLVRSSFSAYCNSVFEGLSCSAGPPAWFLFVSRANHSLCPSRQSLFDLCTTSARVQCVLVVQCHNVPMTSTRTHA